MTFLVIDLSWPVFCLYLAYCLKSDITYMTLFLTKNLYFTKQFHLLHLFSQLALCRANNNTTSQDIGETNAWEVSPPQIEEGTVLRSPLSLRPCHAMLFLLANYCV